MQTTENKKILVTSALPYANGPIHMGHLVEYIQTDIWVRFQKMLGNKCIYICADDTHGTPIMISAKKANIKPEELIKKTHTEHLSAFKRFFIEFDNYYTTHSPENQKFCEEIYDYMCKGGHIAEREISQFYCKQDQMFLPDRLIRGECPKCGAKEQYGDACEVCSTTYSPTDLKEPKCSVCGQEPIWEKTSHYFFKLGDFTEKLQNWYGEDHLQTEVKKKLSEWFEEGLKDWDISRDAPYFGFKIPGTDDKYFYVWLDAPVGYMASTKNWCDKNGEDFDSWWKNKDTEIYHFIGKDIMYFHCLFWPAMLMCSDYRTPDKVFIHGFLTVDGEKMSKSRGTFIKADTFADHLNPEYLRYYYACKMSGGIGDIDLNLNDFQARINSDIIGKIANLGVRASSILSKNLEGMTGSILPEDKVFIDSMKESADLIEKCYKSLDFAKAMREISRLADVANKFVEDSSPWALVKTEAEAARAKLTTALEAFRILSVYIKPVLPEMVSKIETHLKIQPLSWKDLDNSIEKRNIGKFPHLAVRIEREHIDKVIEATISENNIKETPKIEPIAPECTIDDFAKIDLRVAKIINAEYIEEAKALLRLTVDLGEGKTRNIFAGIKSAYTPEQLIGTNVVVVANLKPRKMKFGISEGMVIAAGEGGENIFVLRPDSGACIGDKVH